MIKVSLWLLEGGGGENCAGRSANCNVHCCGTEPLIIGLSRQLKKLQNDPNSVPLPLNIALKGWVKAILSTGEFRDQVLRMRLLYMRRKGIVAHSVDMAPGLKAGSGGMPLGTP